MGEPFRSLGEGGYHIFAGLWSGRPPLIIHTVALQSFGTAQHFRAIRSVALQSALTWPPFEPDTSQTEFLQLRTL